MSDETAPPRTRRRSPKQPAGPLTFAAWAKGEGLSPDQLAELLGIHRATIYELLAGRRWPSVRTAMQIMETSGGLVRHWDVAELSESLRVRVRPYEPRPASGKRR